MVTKTESPSFLQVKPPSKEHASVSAEKQIVFPSPSIPVSGDLKNKLSLSENPKVEKAAAPILSTGCVLLGVLKAVFLILAGAGLLFVMLHFIVHLALPLAIILGILCTIAAIFSVLWGFFELGKPQYLHYVAMEKYEQGLING